MPIKRINIEQQFAQIGVRTNTANLKINSPRSQITINNNRPQLSIDTQMPTFEMNKQQLRAETGLRAPLQVTQDFRNKGKQTALEATGQFKRDGNYLANYKMPARDRVPNLAKDKSMARLGPKEYNIGLMPKSTPDLIWQKGYVNIEFSKHSLQIDYSGRNTAEVSLDPGMPSVEVYLRQRPYFSVSVVDAVPSSGRFVNTSI